MTPTLVRHHAVSPAAGARARDWAEIQERMLVPLYEAVYERLEVGPATRLLGLGCGSGLALLIAASRGASVTGVDRRAERIALARERLLPVDGRPSNATASTPYNLITAFEPIGCAAGDAEDLLPALKEALGQSERGSAVVLTGWGPPERCATSAALRVAARLADAVRRPLRDDLEEVVAGAGLRPDGSGRVACPFGYANTESAVRGLLSTGLFDAATRATDPSQVEKELTEALHPHLRRDGTVWMPNVFRYVIARIP
ncbi:methyltransferase domain-containing protein [Streptomyces beijiangensis]|uniref:SAM-dependent methyltransferase n=1 Tax=Streptomyces beijiangensis TaxID=163361 RepID=A0A939F5Z0_9ACTN|nr:methyltransferase domain-containing protein [Streptomyces beijiangensis]MBO0510990.1 SAM-dependent methyltransferase [Streptomyces beijiangensis]